MLGSVELHYPHLVTGESGDDLILAALTGVDWVAPTKPNQMCQPQRNPNYEAKEISTKKPKKSQL